MGQEAFDAFARAYYQANHWEIATGEGLRQLAEAECGCDLTALFEEWVYPAE
jgi:aminopeptidase N